MRKFEYLEDEATADLAVRSYGKSTEEAFANMALAMFNTMTPLDGIEPRLMRDFEVKGEDLGELLYNFLEEFLYIRDVSNLVFSRIKVEFTDNKRGLKAICWGELLDTTHHKIGVEIKAVTYHLMCIDNKGDSVRILVVFDI